ncbi:Tn3 family transposase [Actinomadura opuntiae]|uniref:Tn3 family transposase n=1 Tax=Actinomadura sp. OS1-43 TaxID=604315 RepID=UPI00255AE381|nr:Tn3 family transposase [Actinomadura sp. OS1-43]MDL4813167.1 Tn3 family transposase [Actinomadura sp. OS1-43]
MTTAERTAYPVFKPLVMAKELHVFFTPTPDEAVWARERTDSDEHLLALTLALKCFQKMARFPKAREVPPAVTEHVRRCLELGEDVEPVYAAPRTAQSHRVLVRRYVGVTYAPGKVRKIAGKAMYEAAWVKNDPADLINAALERLVQASLELPAFSTLDAMESKVRGEVNSSIFKKIWIRLGRDARARLQALLVVGPGGKSDLQRLKQAAGRATWSKFKGQAAHLEWTNGLGDMAAVLEGIAASKIADFAGEAHAADADVLARSYSSEVKRLALLACLVYTAQARARDDLAQMMCKRMAVNVNKAKRRLAEIHDRQRAVTEQLIGTYRQVLQGLAPTGAAGVAQAAAAQMLLSVLSTMAGPGADGGDADETADGAGAPAAGPAGDLAAVVEALLNAVRVQAAGMGAVCQVVEEAGGFNDQLEAIEEVTAYRGDNHELLIGQYFKSDRPTMLALAGRLEFEATSEDHSVLDALDHALAYWSKKRDFIPDHVDGVPLDLSFVSVNWRRAIRDRKHPGMLVKRHFEAMVFTYLAEELRTGDVAVAGGAEYGDWSQHLLSFEECRALLPVFCEEAGLPSDAHGFVAELKQRHAAAAASLDAGYHDNEDLSFDDDGVPTLKKLVGVGTTATAVKLGEEIKARLPERTLIQILSRTAYWLGWWRHFGPASGKEPKLKKPQDRYVLTTFACGSNMGPYEAARHIAGITAHEISLARNRHVTLAKLNKAIAEVVNAFAQLDVVRAWGDGGSVGTDGTQVDTYIDNLVAESHIRYGGFGGIAYHYVSDNYIAIFSRFVPCGAWEAIYIIDGLLANASELKPRTVHADTQGQSFPVFTLAHLFGFDLMPRIRNWKGLTYFQHSGEARYQHIGALFADGSGRANVIDWKLIEKMWPDLMRVAISIREGRLNSVTLLRRLGSGSRRNEIYRAFREVGRSVRTVALLRYLADPALRRRVTAVTNKVEAYNGFAAWLRFGNGGVINRNDPAEQEKTIKFNSLLANCVIFHTALDMTEIIRQLIAEGWEISAEDIAQLSPYLTEHIARFGLYATDVLQLRPKAFDAQLADVDFDTLQEAA